MSATVAGTAALENTANRVAVAGQRPDYRAERWAARGVLWDLSGLDRVRGCGRWSILPDCSVHVRKTGEAVGFSGLASCGSVWACPVCNARIQAVRRLEVGTALAWVLGSGGGAAFGAYTLRHHRGSSLDALWRALSKCWQAVARDYSVRALRESLGVVGIIRAAEVTYGANGWHPHLHPVFLFSRPVSDDAVAALHSAQFAAWSRAADRLGLEAPTLSGQDLHAVTGQTAHRDLADYFTKTTYRPTAEAVGWEMTSTQTKSRSRASDSRTPWDLLDSVRLNGDADDLDLWREYEAASKGKRALTWSRGLRTLVGLDVEASDEEIAEQEVGTAADTLFIVNDWAPVRADARLGAGLLAAVKRGGFNEGRRFCDAHGIEWRNARERGPDGACSRGRAAGIREGGDRGRHDAGQRPTGVRLRHDRGVVGPRGDGDPRRAGVHCATVAVAAG